MILMPCASTGMILLSNMPGLALGAHHQRHVGAVDVDVDQADLGAPPACSASARFTATVDLPTPPLPEDTAIVCLTSGMRSAAGGRRRARRDHGRGPPGRAAAAAAAAEPILTCTRPHARGAGETAFVALLWSAAFVAGAWPAKASVKETSASWT